MGTAVIVALIGALLGGSGITATVLTICLNRKFAQEDKNDAIANDIKWLKSKSTERDVAISKLQLSQLIQHCPKDHRAILSEAEHYFLDLNGNSWVYELVSGWAKSEKVDIGYLERQHNNKGGIK